MITSTPPPPPTPVETAEWVTDVIEQQLVAQDAADRYAIGDVHCTHDTEAPPVTFVCTAPWIHHGVTEYLTGRFTWAADGWGCHGWTVTDEPPLWYEIARTPDTP